jgi:hypothetical protein
MEFSHGSFSVLLWVWEAGITGELLFLDWVSHGACEQIDAFSLFGRILFWTTHARHGRVERDGFDS